SGSFSGSLNSSTNGAGFSFQPFISANGRIITYISDAANLVTGQRTSVNVDNVFSYDTLLGKTNLVSGANGSPSVTANDNSSQSAVSNDGSTIAFLSNATNLTPGQGQETGNVFVYHTFTGTLTLVSHIATSTAIAAGGIDPGFTGTFADLSLSAD